VTASYVTLVLDLFDGEGNQLRAGTAVITPSSALTDVPDMQVIPPASAIADFRPGVTPMVRLLASDNAGPQPAGWAWGIEAKVPGGLEPWSFFVPAGPVSFTATSACPAVFTWSPGSEPYQVLSLPDGTGVQLSGGSLPSGFAAGATYFVTGSSGGTVQLAAYQGGPPLRSLSVGSGELTVVQWQLSALAPVEPVTGMGGYLPVPAGTPAAGLVPVASGSGEATAWGDPFLEKSGDVMTGPLAPAVTALTDAAAVDVDASNGNDFTVQLTAAVGATRQINAPASPRDGQNITFLLRQPSSGGPCAVTWATGTGGYDFGSATAPVLSTSANAADLAAFKYSALLSRWLYLGSAGGF
jgi:hypothetical protein